ncbi:hypothetical protein BJ968_004688 [Kineococcus aurantiacus]|uniref:Uncharacterized protein n=1 Tax=Kineococcus aurantiacus TaxID=37633 RepID=A0A7Y9DQY6_9ACTN|nr:hypothetical protein [Kineococcus aurantiacus]
MWVTPSMTTATSSAHESALLIDWPISLSGRIMRRGKGARNGFSASGA